MKYKISIIITFLIINLNANQPQNIITEYNSPPPEIQKQLDEQVQKDKLQKEQMERELNNMGNNLQNEDIRPYPIQQSQIKKNNKTFNKHNHGHDHEHNHDHDHENTILNNFHGHIAFFGKTNMLGKVNDSYGAFSASMNLTYDIQKTLYFGLGIYGLMPFMEYPNNNSKQYADSKFVTNNAYVKYIAEDFFTITAGRYHESKDWLMHYVQGVSLDIDYSWAKIWGTWVDEQAHSGIEHLTNYNVFEENYDKQWMANGGVGVDFFGVEVMPYYYYMNNYFWAVGGKIVLDFDINDKWNTRTTTHYVSLHSKINDMHSDHDHDEHDHKHSNLEGNSSIFWIEEAINYKNDNSAITFGIGFLKVWTSYFALADFGNMSRFETHSHQGYGVIEPGGLHNGANNINMFEANTRSIYGFTGFEIDKFAFMILGRNSTSTLKRQDEYSIGGKYEILDGLSIGGIVAYMLENKINMSFAKGYIQFKI